MRSRRRDTDLLDRFAHNLREARLERGWSQEELASRADLHRTYVSNLERATVNVSLANAVRLARTLKVSLDDLIR